MVALQGLPYYVLSIIISTTLYTMIVRLPELWVLIPTSLHESCQGGRAVGRDWRAVAVLSNCQNDLSGGHVGVDLLPGHHLPHCGRQAGRSKSATSACEGCAVSACLQLPSTSVRKEALPPALPTSPLPMSPLPDVEPSYVKKAQPGHVGSTIPSTVERSLGMLFGKALLQPLQATLGPHRLLLPRFLPQATLGPLTALSPGPPNPQPHTHQ